MDTVITLNKGENIIRKDVTCIGIQITDRQWYQEVGANYWIELYLNGRRIAEKVYRYLIAGDIPFPCEFKIPANSIIELKMYPQTSSFERVSLICKEGLQGEGEGYLYGFGIFPEVGSSSSEFGYAIIKPFPGEKFVIKKWTFFTAESDTSAPTFPSLESGRYGLIDIIKDEMPFIEKASFETVFSKRDFYQDVNIEFKKLLYFKTEPLRINTAGGEVKLYPFVLAFIKRYELKDHESGK
jgi:hypothetical protein